jgi:uncharacterized LabA/DUF88 family protein
MGDHDSSPRSLAVQATHTPGFFLFWEAVLTDRAVLFIDGNNWYHGLKEIGVKSLARLDYHRISEKMVSPRRWDGTRYYIGRMKQHLNPPGYAAQRKFLSRLSKDDPKRITYHLGRLEIRETDNEAAKELLRYLAELPTRMDKQVYQQLVAIGKKHRKAKFLVEKAVDVNLAVDMVMLANQDDYDAAYLLAADGDYTPAVKAVKEMGKKVYAFSALHGAQLASVCDAFIHVKADWFDDCYR